MKKARTEIFEPEVCVALGMEHRYLKDVFSLVVSEMHRLVDCLEPSLELTFHSVKMTPRYVLKQKFLLHMNFNSKLLLKAVS